jgi:hypothetical protein
MLALDLRMVLGIPEVLKTPIEQPGFRIDVLTQLIAL